jgi:hypothetical protein
MLKGIDPLLHADLPDPCLLDLLRSCSTTFGVRPPGRTGSGCCFDRLPGGVVVLELGGAQIAKG